MFQIPYWVRPLRNADGGTYARLISKLIGPDVRAEPDGGRQATSARGTANQKLDAIDVSLPEGGVEMAEQTLQRVSITDREYMLMRKLGALAGRTPRAVKRFVNLYRLIRVKRRGTRFLIGATDDPNRTADRMPDYPSIMFWLAAEVGLPVAACATLRPIQSSD